MNSLDLVAVTAILFVIAFFGKNVRLGFNVFELSCLGASGTILALWRLTKLHSASNIAIQAVMTIAYLPTFYELWYATQRTEPLGTWVVMCIGGALALVPPAMKRDTLAILYAARAIVLSIVVIALILRIPS